MQGVAKPERLEARIPSELKAILVRAASLQGRTLTDFVLSAATNAAREAIEQADVLVWSARDQAQFAEDLAQPAPANANLQAAARRYRERGAG